MDFLFIGIGLILGGAIVFLAMRITASGARIKLEERIKHLDRNNQELKAGLSEKENAVVDLKSNLSARERDIDHLKEKLDQQKDEILVIQKQFTAEFENLANKIFDDKSQKFVKLNQEKLDPMLNPLKDKIDSLNKRVEETYEKETKERITLKGELQKIFELNQKLSEDASNLTKALKGDSKAQGDWGELQVEKILEHSGLTMDIHFTKQESIRNEEGSLLRPDFILYLPDKKSLILDSKVSLTAYEKYFNSDDKTEQEQFLSEHLLSVRKHISELGKKNYQALYSINQPDYILMFLPLEGAFSSALKEDPGLYVKAMEQNIVLVTTSTLLATLRTIAYMWRQEDQKSNVFEIAKESGKLYEKFVNFLKDLEEVGKKLDDSRTKYDDAMNKLITSPKKGDTIIGRMERIKKLGAGTTKSIPPKFLDDNGDDDNP